MPMNAITAEDLVVRYGPRVAIDRSTFAIPSGGVAALIGPNGSGKSTLLNAIAGLVNPSHGRLDVAPLDGRPRRVSYVLQTTKVNDSLPISVREVVRMGRYAGTGRARRMGSHDHERVEEAMERTGVTAFADRHLHELSGGQRQRVFVAQGLAQDHDILLLDEPMTGLDLPAAQAVDRVIHEERARGCTILMSTHDLSEAQVADFVVLLSGRVVAAGPPEEVLQVPHLVSAYGANLLHISDRQIFVDDPAHIPVDGRHVHRERTIHVERSASDLHQSG
jgi:iron complex transport system ATP-binding protein